MAKENWVHFDENEGELRVTASVGIEGGSLMAIVKALKELFEGVAIVPMGGCDGGDGGDWGDGRH